MILESINKEESSDLIKNHDEKICDSDTESTDEEEEENSDFNYDPEVESKNIIEEMGTISTKVRKSRFYSKVKKQIRSDEFQRQLNRVLKGSHNPIDKVPMVIYALGSLEESIESEYQLALALLLQKDFSDWISNRIEVYDPVLSSVDIIVLRRLGCIVLSVDEECKRRIERPTLFFMPFAPCHLEGNLLKANWSPSNINNVILLSYKISAWIELYEDFLQNGKPYADDDLDLDERMKYVDAIRKCIERIEREENLLDLYSDDRDITDNVDLQSQLYDLSTIKKVGYMEAIRRYAEEIEIPNPGKSLECFLYTFAFHFFNVTSEINMKALIPGKKEMRLKFKRQYNKLPKLEQVETVNIFWAFIVEELNQLKTLENV